MQVVGSDHMKDDRSAGQTNDEWSVGQAEFNGVIDKIHMRTYDMPQAILPLLDGL